MTHRSLRPTGILTILVGLAISLVPAIAPPRQVASVWVAETGAVLLCASGLRVIFEPMDLTEPFYWANGLLTLMFVVHPYLRLTNGTLTEPYHNLFYIAPWYNQACLITFVGVTAFNLLYLATVRGSRPPRRIVTFLTDRDITAVPPLLPTVAGFCTAIGLAAGAYGAVAGGSLTASFAKAGSSSAYLYMAPLLLAPAACLWYAAGHIDDNPIYRRRGWVIALSVGIITILAAQRLGLVTAVGPFFLTVACLSGKRVPRILAIALLVVAMFGFSLLRDLSGPSEKNSNADKVVSNFTGSPGTVLLESLDGSDTEMTDAVALESSMIPGVIGFSPLQEITATLGAAIPRAIWPGKPMTMDQQLNLTLLGRGINQASVAYSFTGEGWYAGGYIGVALLMGGAGVAFAQIRKIYQNSSKALLTTCLYALVTPLTITLLRGALAYTLAYCLFYLGPVVYLLVKSRQTDPAERYLPQNIPPLIIEESPIVDLK